LHPAGGVNLYPETRPMITTKDIQRLIQKQGNGREILSLFLDMSVTSDNKRTHHIFLSKEKAAFTQLRSDRERHHREPLGAVFAAIDQWIDTSYEPTNRGVAIFAEVGGDWFEAFQFPTPVRNRLEILEYPLIGPLTQVVRRFPRYGVIVVDREHLRLLSLHMGQVGEDYRLEPDAIPTPHDVQAGGYSHKDYQKRKAEETRHFYRDFAEEIGRFDERTRPDHFALLGTTENTRNFREFLPKSVDERIMHVDGAPPAATAADIVRHLQPILEEHAQREEASTLDLLQSRVTQSHYATAGVHDTLVQLQEGKVDRLLVAHDLERQGVQCTQCSFYLVRRDGACPYCGGELRDGIDLVESMIRMAANQSITVDFVAGDNMQGMNGVGALLKF
jgi:peptide subunit release factor 1 (eRF1)